MTPIILRLTYFPLYSWPEYSDCISRHIRWMFWLYLILNWLRGNMCDFTDGPEWRSGDSDSQLVPQTRLWPHGLNVYRADVAASPSSLLLIAFSTASPLHSSALQDETKAAPTPFPLEFTGSLPQHGNDVIQRKK